MLRFSVSTLPYRGHVYLLRFSTLSFHLRFLALSSAVGRHSPGDHLGSGARRWHWSMSRVPGAPRLVLSPNSPLTPHQRYHPSSSPYVWLRKNHTCQLFAIHGVRITTRYRASPNITTNHSTFVIPVAERPPQKQSTRTRGTERSNLTLFLVRTLPRRASCRRTKGVYICVRPTRFLRQELSKESEGRSGQVGQQAERCKTRA